MACLIASVFPATVVSAETVTDGPADFRSRVAQINRGYALDKVAFVSGDAIFTRSIDARDSDDLKRRAPDGSVPVYEQTGSAPGKAGLAVGTSRVLFEASNPSRAASAKLESIEPVDGAPGWYAGTVKSPFDAPAIAAELSKLPGIASAVPETAQVSKRDTVPMTPNDPLFAAQFHLNNVGQNGAARDVDANVPAAWQHANGAGVRISFVDDGLQYTHPDLAAGYVAATSKDYCDGDLDPAPDHSSDFHGTAVAGVAVARTNNALGASAPAYGSTFSMQRLVGCLAPDASRAAALGKFASSIGVSSNSWSFGGDPGVDFIPLPDVINAALAAGTNAGRGGKGIVYLKSAGNEGTTDTADYDMLPGSRFVATIGAIGDNGSPAWYSESCACLLVSAPSSGGTNRITTTDLMGPDGYSPTDYTDSFGGTSSATPLVAGIVAQILQVNPTLSWRDVQAILARSARTDVLNGGTWTTNAAGLKSSPQFGFGLVDADAALHLAAHWKNFGPPVSSSKSVLETVAIPDSPGAFPTPGAPVFSALNIPKDFIVERVELQTIFNHEYINDVRFTLASPCGTDSIMLPGRASDAGGGESWWQMTSTQFMGERSAGTWTLTAQDVGRTDTGWVDGFQVTVHGHAALPGEVAAGCGPGNPVPRGAAVLPSVGLPVTTYKAEFVQRNIPLAACEVDIVANTIRCAEDGMTVDPLRFPYVALDSGAYTLRITAPGMAPVNAALTVGIGTTAKPTVTMKPLDALIKVDVTKAPAASTFEVAFANAGAPHGTCLGTIESTTVGTIACDADARANGIEERAWPFIGLPAGPATLTFTGRDGFTGFTTASKNYLPGATTIVGLNLKSTKALIQVDTLTKPLDTFTLAFTKTNVGPVGACKWIVGTPPALVCDGHAVSNGITAEQYPFLSLPAGSYSILGTPPAGFTPYTKASAAFGAGATTKVTPLFKPVGALLNIDTAMAKPVPAFTLALTRTNVGPAGTCTVTALVEIVCDADAAVAGVSVLQYPFVSVPAAPHSFIGTPSSGFNAYSKASAAFAAGSTTKMSPTFKPTASAVHLDLAMAPAVQTVRVVLTHATLGPLGSCTFTVGASFVCDADAVAKGVGVGNGPYLTLPQGAYAMLFDAGENFKPVTKTGNLALGAVVKQSPTFVVK